MQIAKARFGIVCEQPGKGSHWKFRANDGKCYTVPAHNGPKTEIPDQYIRGLCRAFGIEYDEMRKLLGS
jgi:predicted RNA binding protein YcfA (HicA-like mRNA interferase family)